MKTHAFGRTSFSRDSFPDELRDLSSWPSVDVSALTDADRTVFLARRRAIELYIENSQLPLADINDATGIDPKTVYRLIDRCLAIHADGRIYGMRAAIPYARLKRYERLQSLDSTNQLRGGGLAGAFTLLLQQHPVLEKLLQRYIKQRSRHHGQARRTHKALARIHKTFLEKCREIGIGPHEYPFNQAMAGLRSLAAYLQRNESRASIPFHDYSVPGGTDLDPPDAQKPPPATRAFEVVEFDGHKIDLRVTVRVKDPFGFETLLELTRIWILVLLDVASRAVIGYKLALSKEYNKDDVACALQAALIPFRPRHYKIPDLAMRAEGGFPSAVLPQTRYACWEWFRFDGAKSHLAVDTLTRLNQIVGCWPDNGPAAEPNERPFVERFFHLLARNFAHRLPGTTGSGPEAIERLLNDPQKNISLLVELEELEDMIEVLLGDYNGTSHSGISNRTPLEAMAQLLAREPGILRTLPRVVQQNLCLLQEARIKPVKGDNAGDRPHINFQDVRYTSPILSSSPALIGKRLRVYFDVRDIRTVKAFFDDGTELGVLTAARPWCYTPHSLRVRQEIFRLKRTGKLHYREGEDPVECWAKYKLRQARTSKRAATDLAKANANREALENEGKTTPAAASQTHSASLTGNGIASQDLVPESKTLNEPVADAVPPQARILKIRRTITF